MNNGINVQNCTGLGERYFRISGIRSSNNETFSNTEAIDSIEDSSRFTIQN